MASQDTPSSSVIFTLDASSKTDTPISTSSSATTSSYHIPASLSSAVSTLSLHRVPPFPQPPSREPVFTVYQTDYLVSQKVRAVVKHTTVGRNHGATVETMPGGKALLDVAFHSGMISECSEDQRALARMFSFRTAEGGEMQALEVYDAKDMQRSRMELLIAVWVHVLWNKHRPRTTTLGMIAKEWKRLKS